MDIRLRLPEGSIPMAHKTYGIDFGTGTVKVYKKSEGIILNERTVVATVGKGAAQRPVAIGDKAYEMFEKVPPNIKVSFPLENGVISQMVEFHAGEDIWQTKGKERRFLYCRAGRYP